MIPKFEKEYISGLKKNGHLAFAPDIRLQTGGNDSFQSLTLKGVGYFFFGKEGTGPAPKGKRPLPTYTDGGFVIPISGGGETDRSLNNVAAVAEIGYIPIFRKPDSGVDCWIGIDCASIGIYLQGGFKFENNADGSDINEGGTTDQSDEESGDVLSRIKLDARYEKKFGKLVIPSSATAW